MAYFIDTHDLAIGSYMPLGLGLWEPVYQPNNEKVTIVHATNHRIIGGTNRK